MRVDSIIIIEKSSLKLKDTSKISCFNLTEHNRLNFKKIWGFFMKDCQTKERSMLPSRRTELRSLNGLLTSITKPEKRTAIPSCLLLHPPTHLPVEMCYLTKFCGAWPKHKAANSPPSGWGWESRALRVVRICEGASEWVDERDWENVSMVTELIHPVFPEKIDWKTSADSMQRSDTLHPFISLKLIVIQHGPGIFLKYFLAMLEDFIDACDLDRFQKFFPVQNENKLLDSNT